MKEKKHKPIIVDPETYRMMLKIFGPNNGCDVEIREKEVKEKDGKESRC